MYASMVNEQLAPGWLAAGRRVYAVGDVHGCADRLFDLHSLIARHLAETPCPRPLLLHLGDLVDRGPDSARVIARLSLGSPLLGVPVVNLMGNHEWLMLRALAPGDAQDAKEWLSNGGDAALRSWGARPNTPRQDWPALLPENHLAFVRDLQLYHLLDGYLFVHAGVRPEVPLAEQSLHDLLWIRRSFLDWDGPLLPEAPALVAVHGHTPAPRPEVRANRIGLDTGAVRGGKLTCGVLEADRISFLQA